MLLHRVLERWHVRTAGACRPSPARHARERSIALANVKRNVGLLIRKCAEDAFLY